MGVVTMKRIEDDPVLRQALNELLDASQRRDAASKALNRAEADLYAAKRTMSAAMFSGKVYDGPERFSVKRGNNTYYIRLDVDGDNEHFFAKLDGTVTL